MGSELADFCYYTSLFVAFVHNCLLLSLFSDVHWLLVPDVLIIMLAGFESFVRFSLLKKGFEVLVARC